MTEGYLWTGQYEEAQIYESEDGNPQSMKLDEETLKGHWSKDKLKVLIFSLLMMQ